MKKVFCVIVCFFLFLFFFLTSFGGLLTPYGYETTDKLQVNPVGVVDSLSGFLVNVGEVGHTVVTDFIINPISAGTILFQGPKEGETTKDWFVRMWYVMFGDDYGDIHYVNGSTGEIIE